MFQKLTSQVTHHQVSDIYNDDISYVLQKVLAIYRLKVIAWLYIILTVLELSRCKRCIYVFHISKTRLLWHPWLWSNYWKPSIIVPAYSGCKLQSIKRHAEIFKTDFSSSREKQNVTFKFGYNLRYPFDVSKKAFSRKLTVQSPAVFLSRNIYDRRGRCFVWCSG